MARHSQKRRNERSPRVRNKLELPIIAGLQKIRKAWKEPGRSRVFAIPFPPEVKFESAGPNALKETTRMGVSSTLFFDGKTSPVTGDMVIPGMIVSAAIIDKNTIETTMSREGKQAGKSRLVLSSDGKVLTRTTTVVREGNNDESSVTVFRKH